MADQDTLIRPSLDEIASALAPIMATVDALGDAYGFPDEKHVNTDHFGGPGGQWNDWPPITWGQLRALAALGSRLKE